MEQKYFTRALRRLSVLVREQQGEAASLLARQMYLAAQSRKIDEALSKRFVNHVIIALSEERILDKPNLFTKSVKLALRIRDTLSRGVSRQVLLDLDDVARSAASCSPSRAFNHAFVLGHGVDALTFQGMKENLLKLPPGAPPVLASLCEACNEACEAFGHKQYFAAVAKFAQSKSNLTDAANQVPERKLADHDSAATALLQEAYNAGFPVLPRISRETRLREAEQLAGSANRLVRDNYLMKKGVNVSKKMKV